MKIKRLTIFLFMLLTLVSLFGCDYSKTNYYDDEISSLHSQIDDLQNQINDLDNSIGDRIDDRNIDIYAELENFQKEQSQILKFFPRKGETIEGIILEEESINSGNLEEAGIPYYPESVEVFTPSYILILGERFSSKEDRQTADNYVNPETKWNIISQEEPYDFNGWNITKSTKKYYDSGSEWDGTYKRIDLSYGVYYICVIVNIETVSNAEETCETIAKEIITNYFKVRNNAEVN